MKINMTQLDIDTCSFVDLSKGDLKLGTPDITYEPKATNSKSLDISIPIDSLKRAFNDAIFICYIYRYTEDLVKTANLLKVANDIISIGNMFFQREASYTKQYTNEVLLAIKEANKETLEIKIAENELAFSSESDTPYLVLFPTKTGIEYMVLSKDAYKNNKKTFDSYLHIACDIKIDLGLVSSDKGSVLQGSKELFFKKITSFTTQSRYLSFFDYIKNRDVSASELFKLFNLLQIEDFLIVQRSLATQGYIGISRENRDTFRFTLFVSNLLFPFPLVNETKAVNYYFCDSKKREINGPFTKGGIISDLSQDEILFEKVPFYNFSKDSFINNNIVYPQSELPFPKFDEED